LPQVAEPAQDSLAPSAVASEELEKPAAPSKPTYWLTRFLILRLLGLVYLVAFLVFLNQGLPLVGHDGLLPADVFLQRVAHHIGSRWRGFLELPSIFWLGISDHALLGAAWLGAILSGLVLAGFANAIILTVLWALYLSITHVGQLWYGYGWENQLTETGFLAIFLCPLLDPRPFPKRPPPTVVFWLMRWLTFRIMLGAGLIKIRGDPCWRDLSCLDFHFLTQPIPSPISRIFHFMPRWTHQLGVAFNHLCELICPLFVFGPRLARHIAGALLVGFQIFLILSGNLSFLNWLTLIPILACFDDSLLERLLPARLRASLLARPREERPATSQLVAAGALTCLVVALSIAPASNLMSQHQIMNTAHDPFELVNSYGAFGSVGKERNEIIFEGTRDATISEATRWVPYEFKCKPGDPNRRPCFVAPYHLRLDWQIWFAAMAVPDDEPWALHLIWKLLHNDRGALSLLAGNPFPEGPPRYIRARFYRYEFAPLGSSAWWNRTLVAEWLPALSIEDARLREFLTAYGWLPKPSS
jgi:hypothetical protein